MPREGEGNSAPLSPIARANRPLASGEAISALTAIEPADSPAIVTARGIAAEDGDVALDPLQRGDEIEQAVIAGGADAGFLREFGMREKAERVEAMVERDHDDAARGELRAVVARLRSRADREPAAVNPDHHRQRRVARLRRRPDVEIEAILADALDRRVDVVEHDALQGVRAEPSVALTPAQGETGCGARQRSAPTAVRHRAAP